MTGLNGHPPSSPFRLQYRAHLTCHGRRGTNQHRISIRRLKRPGWWVGSGGQTRGVTAAVTGVRRGKSDGRESRAGAGGDVDGWGCGQDRRQ